MAESSDQNNAVYNLLVPLPALNGFTAANSSIDEKGEAQITAIR